MGIIYKAYFQCCGCGIEYDNPDKVRTFKEPIINGDRSKQYINSGEMYCVDCLPLVLDFGNNNPETVRILDRQELEIPQQKQEPIQQKLDDSRILQLENTISSLNKSYISNRKEVENLSNEIRTNKDHILQLFKKFEIFETLDDSSQLEPEIIPEKEYSETDSDEEIYEEDKYLPEFRPTGKFIIFNKISSPKSEETIAKLCGYKDFTSLQETCGSLNGVYYSTDKYIDNLNELDSASPKQTNIKIINGIFFGIPNVVNLQAWIYPEFDIAAVDKHVFNDKIKQHKVEEKLDIDKPKKKDLKQALAAFRKDSI